MPDDGAPIVRFTLERTGDLDRLDVAFEHLGEGALDESAEAPFEGLEDSHEASLPGL